MRKRKNRRRLAAVLLLAVLAVWMPASAQEAVAAAKAPGLNAKVTEKNVLKILDRYDKDGAFILRKQKQAGDRILTWFGSGRIYKDIDTAVHEETHGFSHSYAKDRWNGYAYFVGNKKSVQVTMTEVYPTKKMAASIPKRLRTFRYNTYVAQPTPYLSSNTQGAYGLLNELMAYRAGMSNSVSMYAYYAAQDAGWDAWQQYISNCENGRMAYAEFTYYISHYLYYAKKNYPKVYRGIIGNKQFCKAYAKIDSSYKKLIRTYENDLKRLKKRMEKKGYRMEVTDNQVMLYNSDGYGRGSIRNTADYKKLLNEQKKKQYSSIPL